MSDSGTSLTPIKRIGIEAESNGLFSRAPQQLEFGRELGAVVKKHSLYLHEVEGMPDVKPKAWYLSVRRAMDIFVGLAGLVLLSPLFLVVAIVIKIDSRGPVIYKQERVGKNRKPFNIYKFRTMVADAEEKTGPVWAVDGDPRLTFSGNFLRKSKIDEFPQLVNLVRGNMTMVGPRPERPHFVNYFAEAVPGYVRRLEVTPGITGLAQLRNGYDREAIDVIRKLRYDVTYMKKMRLSLDMRILAETFWDVITGKF